MFQRRRILWIGILIFGLSSAAAVISPDMRMLLVFRLGQGVGASMIFSTNIAILVGAFDGGMRGEFWVTLPAPLMWACRQAPS